MLRRTCPDHGLFEAVVYGDAVRYRDIQRFDKPGNGRLIPFCAYNSVGYREQVRAGTA